MGNPKYPLELFLRIITVSLETMKIVNALPALEIGDVALLNKVPVFPGEDENGVRQFKAAGEVQITAHGSVGDRPARSATLCPLLILEQKGLCTYTGAGIDDRLAKRRPRNADPRVRNPVRNPVRNL